MEKPLAIFLEANTRSAHVVGPKGPIRVIEPGPSQKVVNHSPDGFAWGYGGSGPSQLALAILLELVDERAARANYQSFKWDFLADLDSDADTRIELYDVDVWLGHRGLTRKV